MPKKKGGKRQQQTRLATITPPKVEVNIDEEILAAVKGFMRKYLLKTDPAANMGSLVADFDVIINEVGKGDDKKKQQYLSNIIHSFCAFSNEKEVSVEVYLGLLEKVVKFAQNENLNISLSAASFKDLSLFLDKAPDEVKEGRGVELLVKNLGQIGFDRVPDFLKSKIYEKFQEITLRKNSRLSDLKTDLHFLVHCKNLGLFAANDETRDVLRNIDRRIASYGNINLPGSYIQAATDVVSHGKVVLEMGSELSYSRDILQKNGEVMMGSAESSKLHDRVFDAIVKGLPKSALKGEWQHIPQEIQPGVYRYADNIFIEKEGAIFIDGVFVRCGDITISYEDEAGNRVRCGLIEVDGPSHELYPGFKTGRTKRRDELARKTFGDRYMSVSLSEIERDMAQVVANAGAIINKITTLAATVNQPTLEQEVAIEAAAPAPVEQDQAKGDELLEEVVISKADLLLELRDQFNASVNDADVNALSETLAMTQSLGYMPVDLLKDKVGDLLRPLSCILEKLNSEMSKSESSQDPRRMEVLEDVLIILNLNGFESFDRALVESGDGAQRLYSPRLRSVLKQEVSYKNIKESRGPADLGLARRHLLAGRNQRAIQKMQKGSLPNPLDPESKEHLTIICQVAFMRKYDVAHPIFAKIPDTAYFAKIKNDALFSVVDWVIKSGHDAAGGLLNHISVLPRKEKRELFNRALHYNNLPLVKFLCKNGINVDSVYDNSYSPLTNAASVGNVEAVVFLLGERDVDTLDGGKRTMLWVASRTGNSKVIEFLCKKDASLDICNDDGFSPLTVAAYGGKLAAVQILFDHDPSSINNRDDKGRTMLQAASAQGNLSIVKFLDARGATLDTVDKDGFSALAEAITANHVKVVKFLCKKNPNLVNSNGPNGHTMLGGARASKLPEVAKVLCENGADPRLVSGKSTHSPLALAVYAGDLPMLKAFYGKTPSADLLNYKGKDGKMMLEVAELVKDPKKKAEVIAFLKEISAPSVTLAETDGVKLKSKNSEIDGAFRA
jgi:ankyrin repeat protein